MADLEAWNAAFAERLKRWPYERPTPPTSIKEVLECLGAPWDGDHSLKALGLTAIDYLLWVTIRLEPDAVVEKCDEGKRTFPIAISGSQSAVDLLHRSFFELGYASQVQHDLILTPARIHYTIVRAKPRQSVLYLLQPQSDTPFLDADTYAIVFKRRDQPVWEVLHQGGQSTPDSLLTGYPDQSPDGDHKTLSIDHFVQWVSGFSPQPHAYYSCTFGVNGADRHSVFCFAAFSKRPDLEALARIRDLAERFTCPKLRSAIVGAISPTARLMAFSSETEEWFDSRPGLIVNHWAYNTPAGRDAMKTVLRKFFGNVDSWFSDETTAHVVQRAIEGIAGVTSHRVSREPAVRTVKKRSPNSYGLYLLMLLGAGSKIRDLDGAAFERAKRIDWHAVRESQLRKATILLPSDVKQASDTLFDLGTLFAVPADGGVASQTLQLLEPACWSTSIVARLRLGEEGVSELMKLTKSGERGTVFNELCELDEAVRRAGGCICLLRDDNPSVLRIALNSFLGAMRVLS